jgi:hypothetical protein
MRNCDAWCNGRIVGSVVWDPICGAAEVKCKLNEGWIYRAVILHKGTEVFRFGVLIPEKGGFTAKAVFPMIVAQAEKLQCEILKSLPGEVCGKGEQLRKSQLYSWGSGAFVLDPSILKIIEKKAEVYYRVYNAIQYLLIPIELNREDPLIELYCIGKPVLVEDQWHLCVRIDKDGKIIPWTKDEN